MKLVFALAAPFPTHQGTQVYVRGLARALQARGHRVTVVAYDLGEGDPGVEVIRVPVPRGYQRLRSGPDRHKPWIDLRMAAALSRVEADVVHAHHVEALAAALLARRRPLVYHGHTLLGEELPCYFAHFRRSLAALGHAADRTLPRRADAVVAVAPAGAAAYSRWGCRDVTVLPPGLDTADFPPATSRREERTLVYAGNSDAYQRLDVLFAAMVHLPGWKLRVVTHDPTGFPPGTPVIVARSWPEAREAIACADVAALPRTLGGGYPVKLLDYLACGLPVVLSRGLARGFPGEVPVDEGDPVDFARGVLDAARIARRDWGPALLASESWDRRAATMEAVYARVTSATGAS